MREPPGGATATLLHIGSYLRTMFFKQLTFLFSWWARRRRDPGCVRRCAAAAEPEADCSPTRWASVGSWCRSPPAAIARDVGALHTRQKAALNKEQTTLWEFHVLWPLLTQIDALAFKIEVFENHNNLASHRGGICPPTHLTPLNVVPDNIKQGSNALFPCWQSIYLMLYGGHLASMRSSG